MIEYYIGACHKQVDMLTYYLTCLLNMLTVWVISGLYLYSADHTIV